MEKNLKSMFNASNIGIALLYLAGGFIALFLLLKYVPAFGQFGEMLMTFSVVFGSFILFDEYGMRELDTFKEIAEHNTAYGLMMIAFMLGWIATAILVG